MNKLKNILLYFFITFLIFPSEIEHVVSFVPDVISHYNHHKNEHKTTNFFSFVLEHTTGNHEEPKSHKQDSGPLNHNHSQVNINLAFVEASIYPELKSIDFSFDKKELILNKNKSVLTVYLSSIWQPPKFC